MRAPPLPRQPREGQSPLFVVFVFVAYSTSVELPKVREEGKAAWGLRAVVCLPPPSGHLSEGGYVMPPGLSLPVCRMGIADDPRAVIGLREIPVQCVVYSKCSAHISCEVDLSLPHRLLFKQAKLTQN